MSNYSRDSKPPPKIEGMVSLKVDNITSRTGPNELREVFSKFGDIGDIHIPKDRWSGENKGFAFIRFYTKREAEDAMDRMDGRRVDGREIRVAMARYGRPCDERAERRARGDYQERDRHGRRSRSRSRSRSHGRRGRSRSRSRSKDRKSRRRNDSDHRRKSKTKSKSRTRSHSRTPRSRSASHHSRRRSSRSRSRSRSD